MSETATILPRDQDSRLGRSALTWVWSWRWRRWLGITDRAVATRACLGFGVACFYGFGCANALQSQTNVF